MKILVTGGAGFIGSAVVRHIIVILETPLSIWINSPMLAIWNLWPVYRQVSVIRLNKLISVIVLSWIGCLLCTSQMP